MGESEDGDAQKEQIEEQKAKLARQLVLMIILSLGVSAAFYFITLAQNPDLKPNE